MRYITKKSINTKMPFTSKYDARADENREKLIKTLQELTVQDSAPQSILKEKSGAAVSSWSYSERKKKKPKTFAL